MPYSSGPELGYRDIYRDMIMLQSQQNGSRLGGLFSTEMMEGDKTFFDKLGSVSPVVKTTRNEKSTYQEHTRERRFIQEELAEFAEILDKEDLIKQVVNPQSAIVTSASYALGRRKDEIIMNAIRNSVSIVSSSGTSSQALTLSVAKGDNTYSDETGDTPLHTGKLKNAFTKIKEAYGDNGQGFIVIGGAGQLMNLTTEDQQVSGDYRSSKPLEGPGIVTSLSGFMGATFVEYEDTGLDSSGDETVYVCTPDAVHVGIYEALTISTDTDYSRAANPTRIKAYEALGAVRTYEEKVVRISCAAV